MLIWVVLMQLVMALLCNPAAALVDAIHFLCWVM
jgi:hypothetical protein